MTDPVPPRVAGYDVTGLLGAGSGGEVWLGRDRGTGERVALKRVRRGAGLAGRDRLRREAAALAGLTHPHVLRLRSVVGCLDTPDDLVLVLDAALGGSLARFVARQGPRPAGQVVTVLVAVADALAAVHRAGLVHGDVSPSNVLLTADGRPVLGDLGSARLGGGGRALPDGGGAWPDGGGAWLGGGEPAGTPGFADPAGAGGPAADVHGLAATCVFLLTGRPPYDGDGARVPLDPDHGGKPAAPEARRLMKVLGAALHADPGQRPDAAELARAGYDAVHPEPLAVDLLDAGAGPGAGADAVGAPAGGSWGVPITQLSAARWARATPPPAAEPPARRPGRRRGAHARPRPARTRGSPRALLSRSAGSWSALGRRGAAALGTAVVVALAAVTGIAWAGAGPAASPGRDVGAPAVSVPATTPVTGSAGSGIPTAAAPSRGRLPTRAAARLTPEHTWSARLRGLDRTRSAAFAAGDTGALEQGYAAG